MFGLPQFKVSKHESLDRSGDMDASGPAKSADAKEIERLQAELAAAKADLIRAQTIRELEHELLEEGADLAKMGVWEFDLQTQAIQWSQGVFAIHDLKVGQIPPLEDCLAFYAPVDRQRIESVMEQVRQTRERHELQCEFVSAEQVHKIVRVIIRVGGEHGDMVTKLVGVIQDITESYVLERDIHAFIKLTPDLVGALDVNGSPKTLSPSLEQLLGWQMADLQSERILAIIHPEDRALMAVDLERAFKSGEMIKVENRVLSVSGREFWFSWRLFADNTTRTIYFSARDQTETKATERALLEAKRDAEKASQAKTDFLAVMSHELRTPLNPILGFTELLVDEVDNPQHRELLGLVSQAGNHLNAVISDVLDFAKIEAGQADVLEDVFNLKELLQQAVSEMNAELEGKPIILASNFSFDPKLAADTIFLGDPEKINQVIANLLSNAIKFTDEGTVQFFCGVEALEGGRAILRVAISDPGIGIAEDGLQEVFSPFKQLDASRTRRFGGSGLGLAICKKLVDVMGGEITVESTPSIGSTFSFWVPLAVEQIEPPAEDRSDHRRKLHFDCAPQVLLVEDNPTNAFYAKRVLQGMGCVVSVATSGEAALAEYQANEHTIILLDLHMPGMGGVDVLRAIRKIETEAQMDRIPILILTADVLMNTRETCMAAGANGFLSKPVRPAELYSAINQSLNLTPPNS